MKPLTEVSGERSSWATVAISSAWLRSVRRRASVPRRETTTPADRAGGRGAHVAGGDQHLAAAGQQQVALRLADADGEAAVGVGELPPAAALQVLQGQRLLQAAAEGVGGGHGGDAGGGGVEADHAPVLVGDDQAVGQVVGVDAEPSARVGGVRAASGAVPRGRPVRPRALLVPTLIPVPHLSDGRCCSGPPSSATLLARR